MILRSSGLGYFACIVSVSVCFAGNVWVVRPDGVGPVRIGMSLAQLSTTLHERFPIPEDKEEQRCFYVNPANHPGVGIMIEEGRVTRVDVERRGTSTSEGVRVGDSETYAMEVYDQKLKVEPHAYTAPKGHYLTIHSSDDRYGIKFETYEGKIVKFYAGQLKAISYIEGCW
jgi:hypothetical protein